MLLKWVFKDLLWWDKLLESMDLGSISARSLDVLDIGTKYPEK